MPVLTASGRLNKRNPRNPSINTGQGQGVGHMTNTGGQGHLAGVEGQEVDTGWFSVYIREG